MKLLSKQLTQLAEIMLTFLIVGTRQPVRYDEQNIIVSEKGIDRSILLPVTFHLFLLLVAVKLVVPAPHALLQVPGLPSVNRMWK